MMPYLNLFGVAIAFPPLIVLIGIWLGATLTERHANKFKLPADTFYSLLFITLGAFGVGGRLGYAIQHPSAFMEDPISLISRNFGLFDPLSGVIVALLAAVIYGQRKHLSLWPTLDAITPLLAVFMIALPLANLASGSAFGAPANLPWAINLWGEDRHPVQLYEALGAILILFVLWPGKYRPAKSGMYFLQFIGYSAFARLFFEGFRGSSPVTILDLRAMQLIALGVLAAALWQIYQLRQKSSAAKPKNAR